MLYTKKRFFLILFLILIFFFSKEAFSSNVKYEYWDNGKVREAEKYNSQGNLLDRCFYREDGSLQQHIKYDGHNRKIEESYFDSNGKLAIGADGWAAMRWKYKDGNLFEESYYGSDGRLTERKTYNKYGNLIAKQYVGDNIDPSEEFNPIPPVMGHETVEYYSSEGTPEGKTSVIRY